MCVLVLLLFWVAFCVQTRTPLIFGHLAVLCTTVLSAICSNIFYRYEMIMLHSPFFVEEQASLFQVAQRIIACQYPPLSNTYSEPLCQLVMTMLARDSSLRPSIESIVDFVRFHNPRGIQNYEDLGIIGRGLTVLITSVIAAKILFREK